jgi:hypothetical protein
MKAILLHSPDRSELRRGSFLIALGRRVALPLFLLCAALLVQPCAATPFQWEYTGSLNTARYSHTATLLSNGTVLVAGGYNGGAIASAELYDSATGTWTYTGSLNTARYSHTATLLYDGRVLVTGGQNSDVSSLASAELYDPATGTWTYTGSLNVGREGHTATLYPYGTVLVAGGNNNGAIASAEYYDPATGTWTYTGSLNTARVSHTAMLLPNGEVLAAGGDDGAPVASAELYNKTWMGTWTYTGSLNVPRYVHTATLLSDDGRVLVAAGFNGDFLTSAEVYDSATGTWTVTGSLNTARGYHSATLLSNGTVLVAGGNNNGAVASAELYDPATGTWTYTGSLNTARDSHTATLLPNGEVLVAGGEEQGLTLASAELYDTGIVATQGARTMTFRAFIDGSDYVHVQGEHVWYVHRYFELPGRYPGVNVPTYVNGNAWFPQWRYPDAREGNYTRPYTPLTPPLDPGASDVNVEVISARGSITLTQVPDASNNWEAIVLLDDDSLGGPVWYEFYLNWVATTKVQGLGAFDNQGNQVSFKFRASQANDSNKLGPFTFCDPAAGICTAKARIQSLSITGNTADFSGQALLEDGSRVRFNVNATDNGEPGTSDTISISLSNGYSVSGTLTSGDIRIHQGEVIEL